MPDFNLECQVALIKFILVIMMEIFFKKLEFLISHFLSIVTLGNLLKVYWEVLGKIFKWLIQEFKVLILLEFITLVVKRKKNYILPLL